MAKASPSPIDRIRDMCLALPEAVEKPFEAHDAPAFRVRDKIFVMTHGEDGTTVTLKAPPGAQHILVGDDPQRFFVPRYVGSKGWVGINVTVAPDWDELRGLIEDSYRLIAPKRLAALLGGAAGGG
jgi:predicted DNA-binding protein (MmcQ/YjbR family)